MRIKILNRREYEPSRTPLKSFSVFKFSKKIQILLFLSVEHTKMSLNFTLTLTLKGCLMPFNVSCLIIRLLRPQCFSCCAVRSSKAMYENTRCTFQKPSAIQSFTIYDAQIFKTISGCKFKFVICTFEKEKLLCS